MMSEAKKTVLIVDDEPDTCTYFSTVLEDKGFETIIARDGAEGMAKLQESTPDLITLDITMPEKSGVRLYREIKNSEQWKNVPIIIITGVADDFEKFISSRKSVPPPEGYLAKPIDVEKFLELVEKLTA
jgi:CheY-like chemotaxis protein